MRIISLEISNFKTLEHLSWTEIPETGVFVIHGDNEQGKSTILEALHQVLFIKHNSKATQVRASQPLGTDIGPEVCVKVAFGHTECQLRKKWLRGAKAELQIRGEKPYTGAQAEEKFTELFANHVDVSLFQALFTKQGELATTLGVSQIAPLRTALDNLSGETTSNQAGESTEIMTRVVTEYSKYYSVKTHRPTKLLTEMQTRLAEAEENYAAKTTKLTALEDHVSQIERIRHDLMANKEQLPLAQKTAQAKAEELVAAEEVAKKATAAEKELELAQQKAALKAHQLEQRQTLTARLGQEEARLAELTTNVTELRQKAEAEQEEANKLQQAHIAALEAEEAAREELRRATQLVEQVAATTKRQELTQILETVTDLDQQIHKLQAVPEITEETILELQEAEQAILLAEHALTLKATKLIVSATTPTDVQIAGQSVTVDTTEIEKEITSATSITIGAVTARLEPGAGASESAAALTAARKRLEELTNESGFDSARVARRAREEFLSAHQQIKHLTSQRTLVLGEHAVDQIRAELAVDFEPTTIAAATAQEQYEIAVSQFDEAQNKRALTSEQISQIQQHPAQRELIAAEAVFTAAQEYATDLQNQQQEAELQTPLSKLLTEVAAADAAVSQARLRRQAMAAELSEADIESKRQLAQAAQAQAAGIAQKIATADVEIAAQQSYIDAYAGVAEERDHAEAELIITQRKAAELEQRAAAAKLLYEVMVECQQAAHARYAQPFIAELTRLSRPIFGSQVGYLLSDSLEVTQRIGHQGEVFDVAALSGGAQEQLAILIRFAIASLVAEEGHAIPVFFDDALGSSDPSRLVAMGAVFNEIGKHRQVFVLTCVPNRYGAVTDRVDIPIYKMLVSSHP